MRKRYSENKLSSFCVYFVRLMWYYPFNLFSGCLYLAADMEVDILCYTKLPLYWPYQLYKNTSFPLTPSLLVALPHLVCTSQFVCGGVCRRGVVHVIMNSNSFVLKALLLLFLTPCLHSAHQSLDQSQLSYSQCRSRGEQLLN